MAFMHAGVYCPTQRSYKMTLTNTAYQMSMPSSHGYQSLYSEERRDLDLVDARKETFIFYPPSSIPTRDIAAAGFYYTGENYIIRCFCCRLTVTQLSDRDVPFNVHRTRAPNCPFVCKTLAQGMVSVTEPEPEEDTVDGLGLDSSSPLPTDVEYDGPAEDSLVARCFPQNDHATSAVAKPVAHALAVPINKAKLRKENERLRSEITCRKCRRTRVQTLFLPCRHLVACEECASSMDDCVTCNEKILGTVRTYLI